MDRLTRTVVFVLLPLICVLAVNITTYAGAQIIVDSRLDTELDADGSCTLREALNNANTNTDTTSGDCVAGTDESDLIVFNITGVADFSLSSKNGYTIMLNDSLPTITEQVSIDGYTQEDSLPNQSVSPDPINSRILIEVDGSNLSKDVIGEPGQCYYVVDAENVVIRGQVINKCGHDGIKALRANGLTVQGNYIGTDTTGLIDEGNGRDALNSSGHGLEIQASNNFLIGGTEPAQRNVIAGNQAGDIFYSNESNDSNASENNTIQGNYIGVGADGTTALPSGYEAGIGNAILYGNSHNDLIGGTVEGAMNVIGSSTEFGIATRDGVTGTVIQGNYIGTDYTGTVALAHSLGTGHIEGGIHIATVNQIFSRPSTGLLIGGAAVGARNVVSGNSNNNGAPTSGVHLVESADDNVIVGNYIGVDSTGSQPLGNSGFGVNISVEGEGNQIGQSVSGAGNVIAGNGYAQVVLFGASGFGFNTEVKNNSFKGNFIGVNSSLEPVGSPAWGILVISDVSNTLIGGTEPGAGNTISNTTDAILLGSVVSGHPSAVSILGNSIYENSGLAIDLAGNDSLDFTFNETGPNPNDPGDTDDGANGYINHPVINSAEQYGDSLYLNIDLDVEGSSSNEYRVEFFANEAPDSSGYGEGQIFLGSQDLAPGLDQSVNIVLNQGANLTGLSISSTTTAVEDGFNFNYGDTSEYSQSVPVSFVSLQPTEQTTDEDTNSSYSALADTGLATVWIVLLGILLSSGSVALSLYYRYYSK